MSSVSGQVAAIAPLPRREQRAAQDELRVGVVDIGSNSIRLVVFDGLKRVPVPMFNEKVLPGLGRGLAESGKLNEEGVAVALDSLERFAGLARAMGVARLDLLATAAVREASNGPEFVAEVERRCGRAVAILSGQEEARLSALGVMSGMPSARGVMGDLGGGSLELVRLEAGQVQDSVTLPLGPLRLTDESGGDRERALAFAARELDKVAWLAEVPADALYPVGGAWRALARLHMDHTVYPLHMIHGYGIPRGEAEELVRLVGRLGKRSLARIGSVSKRRLETLPLAALVLEKVLERVKSKRVVFSAFGLREGWLFDSLPEPERGLDPLLAAAEDWAAREGRFPQLAPALTDWTAPLFPNESASAARLRSAACRLSDIGWRYHPDYRAEQILLRILRAQELFVEHHERAFLGLALHHRYGGKPEDEGLETTRALLRPNKTRRAEALGAALRLAYATCGGAEQGLRETALSWDGKDLRLLIPSDTSVPPGQTLERRLQTLADALDAGKAEIVREAPKG
ncbi:exopolyphosphatase / guanosine-5'-triphosphate,3'-diphosphate pyrophosphatase [Tistlia consotensis]|uniref:Exopolyphosphatase / guanosine-5'-triphosphate,3'-diphosphate pyrophosphatase n=1 Tax=Tistlia consotensis USBA 355 TaxID=560819 RepID=A0A1Y6CGA9_9PROT|nr:Ppx/GppA family phosphatase [Tistlia consotensis]SMF54107.1 exopolyphosphatase / guanosine-5'-triphosphate,3'-diphosphate pyrophosphatase [Tistlia consotensis USBA 355]SNR86558.1 exopolyphosphatase / guanosine-5'-triphosphate,3'-diphosphate pyrophosphatase [Tistlia consotensis]